MQYNRETAAVELSVFELCAMAHRGGSIDARYPKKSSVPSITAEAKEKLQAREGGAIEHAVFLRNTTCYNGIYYTVTGVVDGVLPLDNTVLVEEMDAFRGRENVKPSAEALARLSCYAYFLCVTRGISHARLRYRVYDTARDTVYDTCRDMTREALEEIYGELLSLLYYIHETSLILTKCFFVMISCLFVDGFFIISTKLH